MNITLTVNEEGLGHIISKRENTPYSLMYVWTVSYVAKTFELARYQTTQILLALYKYIINNQKISITLTSRTPLDIRPSRPYCTNSLKHFAMKQIHKIGTKVLPFKSQCTIYSLLYPFCKRNPMYEILTPWEYKDF